MKNESIKTLFLVDDHEMLQLGLKNFIETKSQWIVSGTAKTIDDAKKLLTNKTPQIIIIDVELQDENGFDLASYIKTTYPSVKIIMYSMHDESDYVLRAKELQINGYISKASNSEEFIKCIYDVNSGKSYIEERLVANQKKIEEVLKLMTKRESLIFQEMLKDKTNAEISKKLNLSKHTVEVYATTIYEKTFCTNRTELLNKYRSPDKKNN